MVALNSDSKTNEGETHGPSGANGVGKIIITKTSIMSTTLILGEVESSGYSTKIDRVVAK